MDSQVIQQVDLIVIRRINSYEMSFNNNLTASCANQEHSATYQRTQQINSYEMFLKNNLTTSCANQEHSATYQRTQQINYFLGVKSNTEDIAK